MKNFMLNNRFVFFAAETPEHKPTLDEATEAAFPEQKAEAATEQAMAEAGRAVETLTPVEATEAELKQAVEDAKRLARENASNPNAANQKAVPGTGLTPEQQDEYYAMQEGIQDYEEQGLEYSGPVFSVVQQREIANAYDAEYANVVASTPQEVEEPQPEVQDEFLAWLDKHDGNNESELSQAAEAAAEAESEGVDMSAENYQLALNEFKTNVESGNYNLNTFAKALRDVSGAISGRLATKSVELDDAAFDSLTEGKIGQELTDAYVILDIAKSLDVKTGVTPEQVSQGVYQALVDAGALEGPRKDYFDQISKHWLPELRVS